MEAMSHLHFDWVEYIVFVMMLLVSTMIGVFFCCYHGGQHTINEYLLGNKNMAVLPVAMSLIASSISGVTLLGMPSEVYTHGAQFVMGNIANVCVCTITATVFLPVFYKLQLVSLYEYLEMRFNHSVRVVASLLFAISWILFIPIVIYGPALAFNQVSGLSVHVVSPLVCVVCIFYTTFGGLKAVVWADAVQGAIMLGAILVVCTMGLRRVGGFAEVIQANWEGERLNLINLDPDPRQRLTLWTTTIGLTAQWLSYSATSPATCQRFVSLPTYRHAQWSVFFLFIGTSLFNVLSIFMGMLIYANYRHCDPIESQMITRSDQILPFFVLDIAGHVKGLPGLFVAGVVCAALSTMSTGLNTLSGTFYEDLVEPMLGRKLDERTASNIMKVLSVLIGILCVVLVNLVEKMGGIVEMTSRFGGVTCGATLGIFILGVLVPQANSKGALWSGVVALVIMSITMVGNQVAHLKYPLPPISVDGCPNGTVFLNNTLAFNRTYNAQIMDEFSDVFPLFRVTVFYYGLMGFIIVMVLGVAISYLTGPTDPATVNPDLLCPLIHKFLPKKTKYSPVALKEIQNNVSHMKT